MSEASDNFCPPIAWYPYHQSDFADELLESLDEAQQRKLLKKLGTLSQQAYCDWRATNWAHIVAYDDLSPAERGKRVKRKTVSANSPDWLLVHYALLQVELARSRMNRTLFHFPPHGFPVETQERHREAILTAWIALYDVPDRDWWPFEYCPDDFSGNPFAD